MTTMHTLRNKLARLRESDRQLQVFGASEHRYEMFPPREHHQIEAFEQHHAITLPAGYRTFLEEIGDGGAGPGYGLFPLARFNADLTDLPHDFLGRPFPHREPWQPHQLDDSVYLDHCWIQGTLRLCHYGCGIYAMLVVSGAQHGHIWIDDRGSDYGIYPDASEPADFVAWYERWLDESLRKAG